MAIIYSGKEFLVCCDCEDDCQNKSKCACWQLTIQQTTAAPGMKGEILVIFKLNLSRLKEI